MKKRYLITAGTLILLTMTVNATQSKLAGCNYTEHMSIEAPQGTKIMSYSSDNIAFGKVGDLEFLIIGTCDGHYNGTVTVKIGKDDKHYAELTIEDNQFFWDPKVIHVNSVGGFNFIDPIDPYLGYHYILKFTQTT
jgi:hypothetical protein